MRLKKDMRGAHGTAQKEANRAAILEFFKANPNATYREAAQALGLSLYTVFRHVKAAEASK